MKKFFLLSLCLIISGIVFGQENIDLDAVQKIRDEGLNNSGIEEIAFQIIDKAGPRLSNSPGYKRAADLAVKQLQEWGLENVETEAWGEFGRGWELNKSYIAMTKPYYMPFIAVPNAWTESTNGLINGNVQFAELESEEDFEKYRGKLAGAIVLFPPDPMAIDRKGDQSPTFTADATRFTEEELLEMQEPLEQTSRFTPQQLTAMGARRQLRQKVDEFLASEGVALVIRGAVGKHGTLFTSSRRRGYLMETPRGVAELSLAAEHFYLMKRLLEHEEEVEIEAEVKTTFHEDDLQGYNVIGEIPGADKKLKSELVMLGAHLDSWHGATGATDNGAGSVVMMEVVRILKETGLKPKRTIRIALWGGEEQGLHGSRNYVKNHFGDVETLTLKPEHEKLSAYYNIDNGTGRIRGIYLQSNEEVRPIFEDWFEPLDDIIDNRSITIRNTGGTDHLGFDRIGLPGFQFIQDPVEYDTRTHHTNMDTYERLVIDDLKQIAVIVASFVYHTAMRDEKLPRETLEGMTTK